MINAIKRMLALGLIAVTLTACGIAAAYRSAEEKTIRDYAESSTYRQRVGVMALANNTVFTSNQIAGPFMNAFMENLTDNASDALMMTANQSDIPTFLMNPPSLENGKIDAFEMAAMARQVGFNIVVSPALVNLRVRKSHSGFWMFHEEFYTLQLQAAATLYDTITGARINFEIVTEEIEIDDQQAKLIQSGEEVQVYELADVAMEMGETLGEQMGEAIDANDWATTVISTENGRVTIPAGSDIGIEPGDRFSILDASRVMDGIDGQRFVVPGLKIGEIEILQSAPNRSTATVSDGLSIPVGSIVVPKS